MQVLRPNGRDYLIVSHWSSEEAFKNWTSSPEFLEGHKRGFEDNKRRKRKEPSLL
ncbi:MAG: antibiotic biosynthesis monooxygenase [Flammeovirgaceae bacterium]|nr:antibiotic biosynthesis monooxygenase [Flammeovirgaceae bacterium]